VIDKLPVQAVVHCAHGFPFFNSKIFSLKIAILMR
jgi:hypothetical protein